MVELNRENRSSFVKVKCPDCENEQVVFEMASTTVDCIVCGTVLAESTGGKALIKAEIVSQFE
ncbi:MAG: 30S ribosomal protein S27e [Methanomicrobiales archaeon 53_19]|uniref:30S ribosomal protein S27e n=1 Tax=Methanocalculus sp. TaxID=2004547 RepID=UPI00074A4047|nr:30S ribosomal protein S27e [Methanocalculus sp.]KUK70830.1 MAG: 30S ribosomal protein S27e [Methanocalculus sp. 52_23]KUL04025.1 MAG: 30S ribosomal protein S27e [Methanomicrobiales archaeon 53_19]HIJ06768.1 30S ribosomal protein S27e [Methanocalculus sp.]